MDKLIETRKERFWHPEAWQRDQWVKNETVKLAPGSRVLDAGAGACKYRPLFDHCRYETQDFCKYQGPLVKYLQPIDYICDILRIPVADASFDAILCTEVFEHVVDPVAVLGEFSRLLKPGGKLFLTAPTAAYVHMEPYHYYSGFTQYWYEYWLPRRGFSIDKLQSYGGPGRFAVVSLQAFYTSWRAAEQNAHGLKRLASLAGRMLTKIPIHYVLAWLLPRFDQHLSRDQGCVGHMVTATRSVEMDLLAHHSSGEVVSKIEGAPGSFLNSSP